VATTVPASTSAASPGVSTGSAARSSAAPAPSSAAASGGAPLASGAVSSGAATRAPGAARATLTAYMRDSEQEAFTKRSEEWNKLHPAAQVSFESLTGGYYAVLKTRVAGGQYADVYYAHTSNMAYQNFANGGTALPIDDMIATNKVDLSQWYPQGIAALKLNGKMYGLPVRGQVSWLFIYYNSDLFRKNGADLPNAEWTLDDLVNAARKLTSRSGDSVDLWGMAGTPTRSYEGACAHVRRWNGEFWDPPNGPGTVCTLDSDQAVTAYQWTWNLMFKDKSMAPPSVDPPKTWGKNQLAMAIERLAGERATYAQNANKQFDWGMQVMPKGPTGRRGGFLSTDTLQVARASKAPTQAFELLLWYTNKDSGIAAALQSKGSLTPGFRPDVYCSPELLNDPRFPREAMQANCDNASISESYTYPANYRIDEINQLISQYETPLWDGKQEPTASYMKQYAGAISKTAALPVQ
jgi:ABC-type glycerol-3-phosphate transport system substrate-binding protein